MARNLMTFPKKGQPLTYEQMSAFHRQLKMIQERAAVSWGLPALRKARAAHSSRGKKVEFFRHQTPEVKARAQEWLVQLLAKHKDKREQMDPQHRSRHTAALVGVATHMAKRDLGLIISCQKAGAKGRVMKSYVRKLKTTLGIRAPRAERYRHPTCGVPEPLAIGQANMEGV